MEIGSIPNSIPHAVAAPFPPLNFAKRGNICPITAKRPQLIFKNASTSQFGGESGPANISQAKALIQKEATKPFIKSIVKTVTPEGQPKTRKVFVVPALPLPCSRTSTPLKSFPTQIADGIDPNTKLIPKTVSVASMYFYFTPRYYLKYKKKIKRVFLRDKMNELKARFPHDRYLIFHRSLCILRIDQGVPNP